MEHLARERPALQLLVSIIDVKPDLQCPVDANVSLSFNGRQNLPFSFAIALPRVTICYYTLMLPGGVGARPQCP